MSSRLNLKFVTTGALVIAAISYSGVIVAAGERSAATTEFSAQTNDPKNKTKGATKPNQAPQRVAPRVSQPHVAPQSGGQKHLNVQKQSGGQKNINTQKKLAPITTAPQAGGTKIVKRVYTPHGPNSHVVNAARIRGVPARGVGRTSIGGRNYSIWRSGYRVRRGGGWRTFVALGSLGALTIGAIEYYPYAYLEAPENICDGMTEDGCQLVYDEVQTMEGGVVGQCVAYCPQQ